MFLSSLRVSVVFFLLFTVLLGMAYPAVVTGIVQAAFPTQANGSLLRNEKGDIIGSKLIGQNFTEAKYFWGRLSATSPVPYNAAASGGSNLGSANPALLDNAKARVDALQANSANNKKVPIDLVTASASGLDPQISIAAALYQIPRIATARNMPEQHVRTLVNENTLGRQFGILGEPRVNVLQVNLALDKE